MRQLTEESLLLLHIILPFELTGLNDEVSHFVLYVLSHIFFFFHLCEDLEVIHFFLLVRSYFADDRPHTVDVVGQEDTTKSLDENNDNNFCCIGWSQIPEADGQHDSCSPVIRPYILHHPFLFS